MIINSETGGVQTNSLYPYPHNWMGEPWEAVPPALETKVIALYPYYEIVRDSEGGIIDIVDNGQRPEPEVELEDEL